MHIFSINKIHSTSYCTKLYKTSFIYHSQISRHGSVPQRPAANPGRAAPFPRRCARFPLVLAPLVAGFRRRRLFEGGCCTCSCCTAARQLRLSDRPEEVIGARALTAPHLAPRSEPVPLVRPLRRPVSMKCQPAGRLATQRYPTPAEYTPGGRVSGAGQRRGDTEQRSSGRHSAERRATSKLARGT